MFRWLLATLIVTAAVAHADEGLDLQSWLDRPGVRAVVVEFYADWCEPCMKAMPRWKALKDRYGRDGLRIVVVNLKNDDEPGKCKSLGWSPDQMICDVDGSIDQRFGVRGDIPSAFLWSWDRSLRVQRGHVAEVEEAVEKLFKELPRVEVVPESEVPREVVDDVVATIGYSAKMRVVVSAEERRRLRELRAAQQSLQVDESSRCAQDRELAANNTLAVALGRDGSVRLTLTDIERGCLERSSKGPTAKDAVENLIAALRLPLRMPTTGRTPQVSASTVAPTRAAQGALRVTCNEEGAEVSIDGRPQGVKAGRTAAVFTLAPGRYQIKVSKPGLLDDVKTVTLAAGQTLEVAALLEKESKAGTRGAIATSGNGYLTITTEPKGAVISLDGKKVGKAPRTVEAPPGRHRVSLSLEWYADVESEVLVGAGETQKVALKLAPTFAELEIVSATPGAMVFVDGAQVGVPEPSVVLPRVTVGRHLVRATKSDFRDVEAVVEVVAGEKKKLTLPVMAASVGTLHITSTPSGAEVELDHRRVGRTPLKVGRLGPGAHAVRLTSPEYDAWEGSASVVEGETRTFDVVLESLLGTVSLTSTPAGQPVVVEGRAAGVTPLQLSLLEGEHLIRVGAPGGAWAVREQRVTVARGETLPLEVTLAQQFGRLVVLSDPPEAVIYLDGKRLGPSPQIVPAVVVGEHRVEAVLAGHETLQETVRVEPESEAKVDLGLVATTWQPAESVKGGCPAGFVRVPAGTFEMGSVSSLAAVDEAPLHLVEIDAFCMARTETTQAEWLAVMESDPSRFKGDQRPVEQVSWDDAVAYCNKRSQREGLRLAYDSSGRRIRDADGYRLPTEAEWEYAARAGTTGDRHGPLNDIAWHGENSDGQTHDVATKVPNVLGLYDMLGNVWEWTGDWMGPYTRMALKDPTGPAAGTHRVNRGGGWRGDSRYVRAPRRVGYLPGMRGSSLGFRVVRPLS